MEFLRELWGGLTDRLSNEPVLVLGVVQACISAFSAFGLGLTGEQVGAITILSAAVLSLIARKQVTPVRPS